MRDEIKGHVEPEVIGTGSDWNCGGHVIGKPRTKKGKGSQAQRRRDEFFSLSCF